ncbi:NTP transferase domain-containing protein [Rhizobiales bacterium]|uniref:NTP transferase domain-containing protein n=1 Tax=Hongsoonwoonella zoysiae TaxID=2821844 RepID=UPI00155FEDF1|nr:molybdopterin-binding/glycosyltransferase family 2 protein [Hongsoonwoonella zoysiae]NRG16574.1 NTP transferase domain-containing protein [Hongsoonwoonella zoysiae]
MKFGSLPVQDAEGALLAHSLKLDGRALKKGRRLSAEDIEAIAAAGIREIIAARLDEGDLHEDAAADRLARAADGGNIRRDPAFTGRVNLFAREAGVLVVEKAAVDAVNRIDPAITFATLENFTSVDKGRMVATAKIIPFAVAENLIELAETTVLDAVMIAPYRARRVGLVATELEHLKPSVMDKTRRITEERLAASGSEIISELRVEHEAAAVAMAMLQLRDLGAEMIIAFGASAIVDRQDVIPSAIDSAGGTVIHLGMPVDPGNLLLLADLDGIPVIGAPGCARSPKENGFDWVLNRLIADLPVTAHDITGLGVGGLLMEIGTRPQPREKKPEKTPRKRKVAGVQLAGGQSRRMGAVNKLLAEIGGKPLVRLAAETALASGLSGLTVVTGHMREDVEKALSGLDISLAHNPDYGEGIASTIRRGIRAVPEDADAALVLLSDMPGLTGEMIDLIIAAYDPGGGKTIVVPTVAGKRGNPVLWDRRYFADLLRLEGDTGARHLIARHAGQVAEVEIGEAARLDVDTPEALAASAKSGLPDDNL